MYYKRYIIYEKTSWLETGLCRVAGVPGPRKLSFSQLMLKIMYFIQMLLDVDTGHCPVDMVKNLP